jgi:hypothetical protein
MLGKPGDFHMLSIDFPNERGTSAKFNSNSITTESGSGIIALPLPTLIWEIQNGNVYSGHI